MFSKAPKRETDFDAPPVLPFFAVQRQRRIKVLCPRGPEFYTPLALNCKKGRTSQHSRCIKSIMCKWTRPFWGTDCRRSPESLSSAHAAPLCSAGIERARKSLQGERFVRCCHTTHSLLFRVSPRATRGGQQQFVTQTLRVHLLGLCKNQPHTKVANPESEAKGSCQPDNEEDSAADVESDKFQNISHPAGQYLTLAEACENAVMQDGVTSSTMSHGSAGKTTKNSLATLLLSSPPMSLLARLSLLAWLSPSLSLSLSSLSLCFCPSPFCLSSAAAFLMRRFLQVGSRTLGW